MSTSSFSASSRELLNFVAEALFQELQPGEDLLVSFRGEETDFLRFNRSRVRQNTSVLQRHIHFELQKDKRRIQKGFAATGNLEWDLIEARTLLQQAKIQITSLPVDPYLVPIVNNGTSESVFTGKLLSAEDAIIAIAKPAMHLDLAGLYAAGSIATGNKNSKGQDHWFSNQTFFVDFSLYNGEKAVKANYAGSEWNFAKFDEILKQATAQLDIMNRPRRRLEPGNYRVYLAPGALSELATMLSWGALSYQAYKDGLSAFKKLADKEKKLSAKFTLSENFNLGLSPRFNSLGELCKEKITFIQSGELKEFLISTRSAGEYKVTSNQASPSETLRALEIHTGVLSKEQILQEIGTGLYLSNLHYVNWSDLQNARVTGMTRFACFWVENGKITAPIHDMRFDVSFYEIFGEDLIDVTNFQELDPVVETYFERALGGRMLPGMLIENFKLTL